jgi:hypothetical protein
MCLIFRKPYLIIHENWWRDGLSTKNLLLRFFIILSPIDESKEWIIRAPSRRGLQRDRFSVNISHFNIKFQLCFGEFASSRDSTTLTTHQWIKTGGTRNFDRRTLAPHEEALGQLLSSDTWACSRYSEQLPDKSLGCFGLARVTHQLDSFMSMPTPVGTWSSSDPWNINTKWPSCHSCRHRKFIRSLKHKYKMAKLSPMEIARQR